MASVVGVAIATGSAIASGIAAGAATAAIVVSAVVTAAVSIASIAIAKSRYSEEAYDSEVSGNQTVLRSPVGSVKMLYGETVVSGVVAFSGVSGNNNENLHMVILLAGHEVSSIGTVYADDVPINGNQGENVTVYRHTGNENQSADSVLVQSFPEWTENHRLRSLAYLHVIVRRADDGSQKVPNIKAVVKGRRVVDTRVADYDTQTRFNFDETTELSFANTSSQGYEVYADVRGLTISTGIFVIAGDYSLADSACLWYDADDKRARYRTITDDVIEFEADIEIDGTKDVFILNNLGGSTLSFTHNSDVITAANNQTSINSFSTLKQENTVSGELVSYRINADIDLVRWGDDVDAVDFTIPNYATGGEVSYTGAASFSQVATDNQEEWRRCWSKNPALCIMDYMLDTRFGFGLTVDSLDLASFESAATACSVVDVDEQRPCPTSNYSLSGVVDTKQKIGNNLSKMLTSCGGIVVWKDGKFSLKIAEPSASVLTIDSDMLRSTVVNRIVNTKAQTTNAVKAIYVSKADRWQAAETDVYRDEQGIIDDGEESLLELDLPYTDNKRAARRLSIISMNQSRLEKGLTMVCSEECFSLTAYDVVTVNIPESDINNELYRVTEHRVVPTTGDEAGGIELSLEEYSDSTYDIEADNEQDDDYSLETPPFALEPPANFNAISDESTYNEDDNQVNVLTTWEPCDSINCVGYVLTATIAGRTAYSVEIPERLTTQYVDSTPNNGENVYYSIRSIRDDSAFSDDNIAACVASNEGVAPPTDFQVVNVNGNTGVAEWTDSTSGTVIGGEVRCGEDWRNSAFLGFAERQPSVVSVTGIENQKYLLGFADENYLYSEEKAEALAVPNPDWWNPEYDYGEKRFSKSSRVLLGGLPQKKGEVHYTGAIIPTSNKLASEQGWETFDVFCDEPLDIVSLFLKCIIAQAGQEFYVSGLDYSTVYPFGYPDRVLAYADVELVYVIKNSGLYSAPVVFPKEGLIYEAIAGDEEILFGVKNYDGEENGFSTDILLRVGSNMLDVVAPIITQQPVDQTVSDGSPATFSLTASGTEPIAYQVYRALAYDFFEGGTTENPFSASTFGQRATLTHDVTYIGDNMRVNDLGAASNYSQGLFFGTLDSAKVIATYDGDGGGAGEYLVDIITMVGASLNRIILVRNEGAFGGANDLQLVTYIDGALTNNIKLGSVAWLQSIDLEYVRSGSDFSYTINAVDNGGQPYAFTGTVTNGINPAALYTLLAFSRDYNALYTYMKLEGQGFPNTDNKPYEAMAGENSDTLTVTAGTGGDPFGTLYKWEVSNVAGSVESNEVKAIEA